MNIYDKKIPVRIKKTFKKSYPSITAKVPKVQKVKVINTPETKVVLPDVQKVEVINQETVKIPEIQKVEVVNPTIIPTLPDIHKVEVTNQIELPDIKIPDIQKVQVLNPTEIPIGNGNIAGKADPEKYVPVRLTDGKKFYKGLEDAYVSAAKTVMPYIDSTGKPTPVRMTNEGKVPVEATLNVGDIEIGAVEIKDGTSDTRAVVGSDGLQVEVKKSALPTGASTAANQSTANTLLGGIAGLVPTAYDYISLSYTGSDLTGVVFKTGGSSGTTVATLTLVYSGANLISVTKT